MQKKKKDKPETKKVESKGTSKPKQDYSKIESLVKIPPIVAVKIGVSEKTLKKMKKNREITVRKARNKWGWGCTEQDIKEYLDSICILATNKEENNG